MSITSIMSITGGEMRRTRSTPVLTSLTCGVKSSLQQTGRCKLEEV
ncbi:MAG: hypothetical protein M3014_13405 [Chloroflexota bacterium]|nr:hypothetical protein [Chloroflexota bacterium]